MSATVTPITFPESQAQEQKQMFMKLQGADLDMTVNTVTLNFNGPAMRHKPTLNTWLRQNIGAGFDIDPLKDSSQLKIEGYTQAQDIFNEIHKRRPAGVFRTFKNGECVVTESSSQQAASSRHDLAPGSRSARQNKGMQHTS